MKTVETYWANIYVGLKNMDTGFEGFFSDAEEICSEYVDKVGLCVTVTRTEYVYNNGREQGVIVGLINYPRFPAEFSDIRKKALELAERLKIKFKQHRVSVMFPDETVMLGEE